jgi:hypothetical protein
MERMAHLCDHGGEIALCQHTQDLVTFFALDRYHVEVLCSHDFNAF